MPKARVSMFDYVVEGRHTAASDIDTLVVMERVDFRYDIMVEVYRSMDAPPNFISRQRINSGDGIEDL